MPVICGVRMSLRTAHSDLRLFWLLHGNARCYIYTIYGSSFDLIRFFSFTVYYYTYCTTVFYFKPHPSKSVMAPPNMPLFLPSLRRDKKTSYPSMVLSCAVVMGLPCKFILINNVSVRSSFGNSVVFVTRLILKIVTYF